MQRLTVFMGRLALLVALLTARESAWSASPDVDLEPPRQRIGHGEVHADWRRSAERVTSVMPPSAVTTMHWNCE